MSELQARIQAHIDMLVGTGAETGVQVAVNQDDALIVDAVAGTADPGSGRALTSCTPIFSFSTGKNIAATLAHVLVAQGLLDHDHPIADLWPEFGAHGKGEATLRHVLTHTVGLPAMPREITPRDLPDWSKVCAALATAEPQWRPGSTMGYHAYTFGYLVGQLALIATGHPMHDLLREWVTAPLGIDGQVYFAAPTDTLPKLALLDQPAQEWPAETVDDDPILSPWERRPSADFGNNPEILGADIPSVGTATARGLATIYNALLQCRLVDDAQLAELSAIAFEGTDQVNGTPTRMALGFPIGRIGAPVEEHSTAFGWPGGGGSYAYAYADPDRCVAFALTKNRLLPNFDTALSVTTMLVDHLARTR